MRRVIVGIILILIGIGLFLDARGTIDFGELMSRFWPVILILLGIGMIVSRPGSAAPGIVLLVLGLVFLAANTGRIPRSWPNYVWPVALVVVGILLIASPHRERRWHRHEPTTLTPGAVTPDTIRVSAFFAGAEEVVRTKEFRGGKVEVAFGGAKVDLRQSELSPQGARLDANAMCGGIEIHVPVTWRVVVNARPFLGGVDNRATTAPIAGDGPTLEVYANAFLGGVSIKN